MYVCMCMCVCVCACVCTNVCVCLHAAVYTCDYKCMYMCTLVDVCDSMFTHTHTHTQACMHAHAICMPCQLSYAVLLVRAIKPPAPYLPLISLPPPPPSSSFTLTDIQTRNYHAGLEKYNQMVTTGSFSEIGSFIPGLKVLLQLALQLNI